MQDKETKEIVVKESGTLPAVGNGVVASGSSAMDIIQLAMDKNLDIAKIEGLLKLKLEFDAVEAEKAFTMAMTAFKKDPPIIKKDKENKQYGSYYTTIGHLINTSLPKMSKNGFSHKWTVDQSADIRVTCIVTHKKGHSNSASMSAPPDSSGSKNPIQQIKSTITYLKAATFESVMGLASTNANVDDDGNGAGPGVEYITEKQKGEILDMIADTDTDEVTFLNYLKANSIDEIPAKSYRLAITALNKKKEKLEKAQ